MSKLNELRIAAGVTVEELADYVGIEYFDMGKMLMGNKVVPVDKIEKMKIFLAQNYTKRIGEII